MFESNFQKVFELSNLTLTIFDQNTLYFSFSLSLSLSATYLSRSDAPLWFQYLMNFSCLLGVLLVWSWRFPFSLGIAEN